MDTTLTNLELDGRVESLELRVSSDLGDGRGNGNVWRSIKDLNDEIAKGKVSFADFLRKQVESNTAFDARLNDLTETIERGKTTVTKLEEINQIQAKQITELHDLLEKKQWHIDSLTDRLNGKGLLQVDPYEKVVSQVRQIIETLQGGEGQLSFPQVRNSIQQTQFLGRVLYGAIGLFGVGAVSAAGLTLFGGEKVAPEVKTLQEASKRVAGDVKELRERFDRDIERRLEDAQKK